MSAIAGLAALLGFVFVFVPYKCRKFIIPFSLSVSFVMLVMVSIFDLIPSGIKSLLKKLSIENTFLWCFILLFLGYLIIRNFNKEFSYKDSLYRVGVLSMVSLLLHNIPEGIITTLSSITDFSLGFRMFMLIFWHNIPEGMCIAIPIYYSTRSKKKAFLYTLIGSVGEMVGSIITILFYNYFNNIYFIGSILIFTGGLMISLALIDILKELFKYHNIVSILLGLLVGGVILLFTL